MSSFSIAENFDQYFEIRVASDQQLREESFRIRHQVYSDELGWEPVSQDGLEKDECDPYSVSILLIHKRTGLYAGTVRYVIPPITDPTKQLPFELHCLDTLQRDVVDPDCLPRGSFGEVSRLAVPDSFRRRKDERNKPFVIPEIKEDVAFSEEEKRNFPNIAIGLYTSALALAGLCNHTHSFVVVERSLCRMMKRLGLHFVQCGDEMEYQGKRAIYYLHSDDFLTRLTPEMRELHDLLKKQLLEQMVLYPYLPDTI